MAEDAAGLLRQAILALYSSYGAEQQQANQWLNSFQHQPAAWEACVQLLDLNQGAEVCFFSANMLLAKVRAEWFKLSQDQQHQINTLLRWGAAVSHAWAAGRWRWR